MHISFIHNGALCIFKGSAKTYMKVCDENGVGGVVDIYTGKYIPVKMLVENGLDPETAEETNNSIWGYNTIREDYNCPAGDWTCPYYNHDGRCMIDGFPWEECDEAIDPNEE